MSDTGAKAVGRPMKYPYTFSAKIAQFPWRFYVKNNWMWKYYAIAIAVTAPLFYKIGKASHAPENVKKWDDNRRRDFSGHPHH